MVLRALAKLLTKQAKAMDFLALVGEPYAKEMTMDIHNRPLERLLYQESLYDREWYTLTTAFTFQDGKLVSQEVINKEYVDRKTH